MVVRHVTNWASNSCRFASSSPCRPHQRALNTPGALPNASTTSPESSATVGRPVWRTPSRAFSNAFSPNVSPVSGTSGYAGTSSRPTAAPGWPRPRSGAAQPACARCGWPAAPLMCSLRTPAVTPLATLGQLRTPAHRQVEQLVQLRAGEHRRFPGALHLDELPLAGADHVHVHIGRDVLGVTQVEPGLPSTKPTLTAATERAAPSPAAPQASSAGSQVIASCSATYAPVIAAVRVPPSACSTSQSSTIEFRPARCDRRRPAGCARSAGRSRACARPGDL